MIAGVHRTSDQQERRVALVPAVVPVLAKAGVQVLIEKGAGVKAGFPDEAYQAQGARTVNDRAELFAQADIVPLVQPRRPSGSGWEELELTRSGQILVGLLNPFGDPELMQQMAQRGVTAFALELLPRISRAQSMDALTSMATVGGYKAVLLAASALPKMFPMMITAAGTVTPARVFVVGAGVAGLQAIATARRLGAVVQAYDVRPAVKEQVESLGARFLEMELQTEAAESAGGYAQDLGEAFYNRQRELMKQAVADSQVVITTAAVPGKKAPVLITEDAVRGMRPQSVIVDLAAETGGNCELTRAGETVQVHGVTIIGPLNLASAVAYDASQMYARNVTAFLQNLIKKGELQLNLEDPVIRESMVTHQREITNSRLRDLLGISVVPMDERSHS